MANDSHIYLHYKPCKKILEKFWLYWNNITESDRMSWKDEEIKLKFFHQYIPNKGYKVFIY